MNEHGQPDTSSRRLSKLDTAVINSNDPPPMFLSKFDPTVVKSNESNPPEPNDIMSPSAMPEPVINVFEDPKLDLKTYMIIDPVTEEAIIIDPVLDFDPRSKQVKTRSADVLVRFAQSEGYTVSYILETAIHSDHLSACRYLQFQIQNATGLRPSVITGANVAASGKLATESAWPLASEDDTYDRWLSNNESLRIGNMFGEIFLVQSEDSREQAAFVIGNHVITSRLGFLSPASKEILITARDRPKSERRWSRPSSRPSQQDASRQEAATPASECSRSSSKVTFKEPEDASGSVMAVYARQVNARGGYIPTKIRVIVPGDGSSSGSSTVMEPLQIPRRLSMLLR